MKKIFLGFISGFVLVILMASVAFAGQPTKAVWDESPESYVEGYYLYYGTVSGNYSNAIQIEGKQNCCFMLEDIPFVVDTKYYLALTAYIAGGVEGNYSNEVTYPVAAAPALNLETESSGTIVEIRISNCP